MATDSKKTKTEETKSQAATSADVSSKEETNKKSDIAASSPKKNSKKRSIHKTDKRRRRRPRKRRGRARSEFDQRTLAVRRVTRVIAGGRRFSFSAVLAIGDRKGRVGVGVGKATDTSLAIEKAVNNAKRNMITVKRTDARSIPHQVSAKYTSSVVHIHPAPGRGVVAGSSVRDVLELAGINDVSAKLLSRSKNKLNNARAAIEALKKLSS